VFCWLIFRHFEKQNFLLFVTKGQKIKLLSDLVEHDFTERVNKIPFFLSETQPKTPNLLLFMNDEKSSEK
jgi:hypothetical protein